MMFEARPAIRLTPLPGRSLLLGLVAALTAVLATSLPQVARWAAVPDRRRWPASAP